MPEIAGLTVSWIINEPTAASLAYGLDKRKRKSCCVRPGRMNLDVSVLELARSHRSSDQPTEIHILMR